MHGKTHAPYPYPIRTLRTFTTNRQTDRHVVELPRAEKTDCLTDMEYHWDTIRDKATEALADPPSGQLEQEIIDAFTDDPDRVIRTIDRIVKAHAKKPFNSPWAVIRKDVQQRVPSKVTASPTKSRQALVDRAKTWIHNAGLYYDTEAHVMADLFGDEYARGPLTDHDTPELRAELAAYWHSQRPRGQQAEADHEAWNAKCKADYQLMQTLKARALLERETAADEDIDFTPA